MLNHKTTPLPQQATDEERDVRTSLTADERETIIRLSDGDDWVYIDTSRRTDITALKKKPDAELLDEGYFGTTAWAKFRIPKHRWSTGRGIKGAPRQMSEEQRQAAAERFRRHRENRGN